MVSRKLNKPLKLKTLPLFWLNQVGVRWSCRSCGKECPAGTVTFECCYRYVTKTFDGVGPMKYVERPVKVFLCLECASTFLDDVKTKIDIVKNAGPEMYRMIAEM